MGESGGEKGVRKYIKTTGETSDIGVARNLRSREITSARWSQDRCLPVSLILTLSLLSFLGENFF